VSIDDGSSEDGPVTTPTVRRGPAPSPYLEDLRDEVQRIRIATELIAQALGHLIPHLVERESTR
jgi:hypothetical protein